MNNQHIPEIKGEKTDQIKNQIALSTVCKPPTLQAKGKGKKRKYEELFTQTTKDEVHSIY